MEILCFVYVKSGSKYTANLLFYLPTDCVDLGRLNKSRENRKVNNELTIQRHVQHVAEETERRLTKIRGMNSGAREG